MNRPRIPRTTMARSLFALDVVLVLVAWPLSLWLVHDRIGEGTPVPGEIRAVLYPLADCLLLYAMGLYRRDAFVERQRAAMRLPVVIGLGALTGLVASALLTRWFLPADHPGLVRAELATFLVACVCFSLCALAARIALDVLLRRRVLRRHLLVVGAGARAWDLSRMLAKEGASLDYAMTFLHNDVFGAIDPRFAADPKMEILCADQSRVLAVARSEDVEQIVVAPDERRGMDLEQLLACKKAGFPVVQYLSFIEHEIRRVDIKRMDLGWLVFSEGFRFGPIDRFLKRAFDIAVSLIMLMVTSPLLLAGAAAIRLEGTGPILYRQERVTIDGRVFRILKLRTMRVDAEVAGAVWAAKGDRRVTAVGTILRRARIDELPQLINILKGEMSFVGPRPERPMFVDELAAQIPLYRERHTVKAGLTGWAQVNYPYGASVDDARSKLSYDLYYVKNFSILFDFVILLQTLRVVLWPSGVR